MCLLSLGAGFDIPPSNCIYIYLQVFFFFFPLHDGTRVYLAPTWRRAVLRRDWHTTSACSLAPLWSIKSLSEILTELMSVSDYGASVRRSCSSCGKSRGKCSLHAGTHRGPRWQTTQGETRQNTTVKHEHRCCSLIITSRQHNCTSLKRQTRKKCIAASNKRLNWSTCFVPVLSKGMAISSQSPCSSVSVVHLHATMCEAISKWNHKGGDSSRWMSRSFSGSCYI